jgi:hypothetical protein
MTSSTMALTDPITKVKQYPLPLQKKLGVAKG